MRKEMVGRAKLCRKNPACASQSDHLAVLSVRCIPF